MPSCVHLESWHESKYPKTYVMENQRHQADVPSQHRGQDSQLMVGRSKFTPRIRTFDVGFSSVRAAQSLLLTISIKGFTIDAAITILKYKPTLLQSSGTKIQLLWVKNVSRSSVKYICSFYKLNNGVLHPYVFVFSEAAIVWFSSAYHTILVQFARGRYNNIIHKKYNVKRFVSSWFLEILPPVIMCLASYEVDPATHQVVRI